MLSRAIFVASRISWSTRRGYQSGAAGIYGHDPGALERLRSVVFSDMHMSLEYLEQFRIHSIFPKKYFEFRISTNM